MDISEIRDMSTDDLYAELDDARDELMRLRFQRATGELVDHSRLGITRKKIARLMTVINERARDEVKEGEA
jgi:large subunit ribosomal protein L29